MSGTSLAAVFLQSRGRGLAALLLLTALVIGTAWLYRRQTQRIRLRWRLTLLTLRLMAVAALSLSLLQPMSIRKADPSEQGAVVIVVDHSHGMSHRDYAEHPDQIVALADGMGLLPLDVRSRGDEWVALVAQLNQCGADLSDAESGLAFARISGRSTGDAEAQVAAATVRFDSTAQALLGRRPTLNGKSSLARAIDVFKQALQLPRNLGEAGEASDIGEDWLPTVRKALNTVADAAATFQFEADQTLYRTNTVVKATCDALAKLDRLGLVELALTQPHVGVLSRLSSGIPLYGFAAGDRLTTLPLRGPPLGHGAAVRHLLLDTDGLGMNLTNAVRAAAQQMGDVPARGIVLFSSGREPVETPTVFDHAAIAAPVLAICTAPPSSSSDVKAKPLAIGPLVFRPTVFVGESFSVSTRIQGIGFPPGTRREIWCDIDERKDMPSQSVLLTRDGTDVAFPISIDKPGPHRIAVGWPGVGASEGWINVLANPMRVAIESATPTWDWRAARRDLSHDPAFAVRADVFADGVLPLAPQEILRQDAMVIFDAQRQSLDASQRQALEQMVHRQGGLLILVGPAQDAVNAMTPPATTTTASLFDWPQSPGWKTWEGTRAQYQMAPVQSAGGIWSPPGGWASLPPIFRFSPLPSLEATARPLLVESSSGAVVAAQTALGRGHVIFIGLDEIWRWRTENKSEKAGWFWPPLLRHFTAAPYAESDGRLALDVSAASVWAGASVDVRIKWVDATGLPRDVPIQLALLRDQKQIATLEPTHLRDGEWTEKISGLPSGTYRIEAAANDVGIRHSLGETLRVLPEYQGEYQNAAPGRDELAQMADTSHGRLLEMDQVRQLPDLLDQAALTPTLTVSLWDSKYLFMFVVACLCAEWALRKRMGLA